jgi:hypothetical protein
MDAKPSVQIFFNRDLEKVEALTVPNLLHLFAVTYSTDGSNRRTKEVQTTRYFTKWLREVQIR